MHERNDSFQQRVKQIGQDIFDLAGAHQPRLWQRAWWLERMTQLVDRDERLKGRSFAFVDCLPSLRTNADVFRHLGEYLNPEYVDLPKIVHACLKPATLQAVREDLIGWGARFGATQMANRFITGYDVPSVLRTLERLRRDGMNFTLDVLGESTTSYAQAERYVGVYHDLVDSVSDVVNAWPENPILDRDSNGPMPRVNLSVKLTGFDPHFDSIDPARSIRVASDRLRPLLRRARNAGASVNIDMESTKHREITFDLFKALVMEDEFRDWEHISIVIQAYLRSGESDLASVLEFAKKRGTRFAIRLVKGAYWDAETAAAVKNYQTPPVWTNKWESDACYERMAGVMLRHRAFIRPTFASHNVRTLAFVIAKAEALGLTPFDFELQQLFGMGDPLKAALVALGQSLRVYAPYGDLMPGMAYLIRRLLENTSNDGFLKQSFTDRLSHETLLADPAVAQPPSAPLPTRVYQNTNPEETMASFTNAPMTSFTAAADRQKMIGAIAYVRGEMGRTYPLIINHEAIQTETWCESVNPSNYIEVVGKVALATTGDADRAVAAAAKAFKSWRGTTASARADILRKVADRLDVHRFELAANMILEIGKTWREAVADVVEAIDHCRYYAEQIERIESRPRLRNLPGENNTLTYSPKGVCAVISPWPFPLAILGAMTTAAIAAGNTVVLKPARQASVIAAKFVQMLEECGLPPGVVNFLPGAGETIGRHLVEHPEVPLVAFTGSSEVGAEVIRLGSAARFGQPFIRKMVVEMGGKNAIIVDDDADLDGAVQAIIESSFYFAGQKCSSCSRLIVVQGVYDTLLNRLKEAVDSLTIGPAENPATLVGPVIDEAARKRILDYISVGKSEGRVLISGKLPAECSTGFFVPPTILVDVAPSGRVAQEEILGPVLSVTRAKDFDQAIEFANNSRYALTGGVFSRSPSHIEFAQREFAAGNLYINRKITGSQVDSQPFGGYRLSGTGVKAGSPDYLLHYMDARCVTENTLRSGFVPKEKHSEVS